MCYKSKDVSICGKLVMDEGTIGNLGVTKIVLMTTSFFLGECRGTGMDHYSKVMVPIRGFPEKQP